jgi:hypothetical protein
MSAKPSISNWQKSQSKDQMRMVTRMTFSLRSFPLPQRMVILFCTSFFFGGLIELFACSTGLYEAVTENKTKRRHDLDEFVAEFQDNLAKWQEEDMQLYAAKKQLEEAQRKLKAAG